MKKITTSIALLAMLAGNAAFGQVWSEDFNNGLPAGWLLYNQDNKTPAGNVSFVTDAWVIREKPGGAAGDSVLISTSWYNPIGQADDWAVTPSFTVTDPNMVLKWDERAYDPNYADALEVRISTTGNTPADFTTVLHTSNPASAELDFATKGVNIGAYNGQTVRIAFRNNSNDKFLLGIDNVATQILAANDVSVDDIILPRIAAANVPVKVLVTNRGAQPITSLEVQYTVDGGTPVSQSFTGLNIIPFGTEEIVFTTNISTVAVGNHTVDVTVTMVNGQTDANTADNQDSENLIGASQTTARACLIEEFTSSTCVPCAAFNVWFDPLILSANANTPGANLNVVKYQMDWPNPGNDASYNAHGDTRRGYYGVTGIPDHYANGQPGEAFTASAMTQEIADCKAEPAFMDISGTYEVKGDSVYANVSVTPYFTETGGSYSVLMSATEEDYINPDATTSQSEYYHVMRFMLPNANGTPVTDWTDNTAQNFSYKRNYEYYNVTQNSYKFWSHAMNSNLVVYVQDNTTKQILQSAVIPVQWATNVENVSEINNISLFPNPAKDNIILSVDMAQRGLAEVNITDALGRNVYNMPAQQLQQGTNRLNIATSAFAAGVYQLMIKTEKGIELKKFSVVK